MDFLKSIFSGGSSSSDGGEKAAAVKTMVEDLIANNHVVVFSKSHCPYCSRAKSLLASLGQNPGLVELDQVSNGSTIQSYLAQRIGASRVTVPQVYIGGKLIGGNSEVQALHAAGQLVPLFRI